MTSAISRSVLAVMLVGSLAGTLTAAQLDETDPPKKAGAGDPPSASTSGAAVQDDDPDRDVNLAQPDFTIVGLPTTLRLPKHKSAFRITHRFGRPLGQGDFGDLVEDFFGLDSGAIVGFEYRYGILRATQVAVNRTNDRTIQFMLQRQVKGQDEAFPISVDVLGSVEGTNNFKDSYSPGLGILLSHEFSDRGAIYAEPMWVNNTNTLPSELTDDNDSIMVGLGARVRLLPTTYAVFEVSPRVAGYSPGDHQISFGLEKRAGGHMFQLNVSNAFGTTFGQIARGGASDWYLGFNLTRKFF